MDVGWAPDEEIVAARYSSMEPSSQVEMARVAMAEGLGRAGLVYLVPVKC